LGLLLLDLILFEIASLLGLGWFVSGCAMGCGRVGGVHTDDDMMMACERLGES
jgi:hypothetical protein